MTEYKKCQTKKDILRNHISVKENSPYQGKWMPPTREAPLELGAQAQDTDEVLSSSLYVRELNRFMKFLTKAYRQKEKMLTETMF